MKKLLLILTILLFSVAAWSQDKSVTLTETNTFADFTFVSTVDTMNASDTYWIYVVGGQSWTQSQDVYIELDSVSGDPNITFQLQGRKFTSSAWTNIGSAVVWTGTTSDTAILFSNATANRYRHYKIGFTASATAQKIYIDEVQFKVWRE